MNIKETIATISEKYGLKVDGESFEMKIKKTIVQILNQIPGDKKIAIKGGGVHTRELLSLEGCTADFTCIFDNSKQSKEIVEISGREWEIYPDSAIEEMDVDVVIISSYAHRKEMREQLKKKKKEFVILDLYDELQKEELDVNAPFYYNAEDTYENVIYYRNIYLEDKSAKSLKNLIVAYLKLFDFINFEKYIMEYITNQYSDYEKLQAALKEIKKLLCRVREQLKKRNQKDIITIWNDQVDYDYLKHTSYMQKMSENSMFFENAYTMTPFTIPTFFEMFQKLKSIDDRTYRVRPLTNKETSEVIRELESAGYEFAYIGDEASGRLFEKDHVLTSFAYNSSCVRCMDLLQKLLDTKKPVCAILHALVETHNPYLSGELSSARWYDWPRFEGASEEIALEQRRQSLAYWDKELAFYMDFISDNSVKIFMSDHGARYNCQPIYKEATTHIMFFITGNGVPQKRCKGMFSLYDFGKIIRSIIEDDYSEEKIFSDYVLMQETNIFNNATIRYYIEHDAEECTYAWRAVRTQKELYVKLSSGKKYYYLLPDENLNCINQTDRERIEWLDKLAGDKFEDTSEYEQELAFFRKQFETHE